VIRIRRCNCGRREVHVTCEVGAGRAKPPALTDPKGRERVNVSTPAPPGARLKPAARGNSAPAPGKGAGKSGKGSAVTARCHRSVRWNRSPCTLDAAGELSPLPAAR
jgi:hypothetical protein